MARPSGPVRTASPVTRQFFLHLRASKTPEVEVARKSGMSTTTLYDWRVGNADASVFRLESALDVLGLELVIRPKTQHQGEPSQ